MRCREEDNGRRNLSKEARSGVRKNRDVAKDRNLEVDDDSMESKKESEITKKMGTN